MTSLRSYFNLPEDEIYLNSGTLSISPRVVQEAVVHHLLEYDRNPTRALIGTWEKLWEVQKGLASFLGADPRDLFLHHNVTEALNDLILGIPLPAGGEIAVTDLEYGAIVNVCKLRAIREGYQLRAIEVPFSPASGDELISKIVSQLKPDTRMLLVSHVFTGNGLILPLAELARITRERGIVLVVDGAHAVGAIDVDFSKLADVDLYAGNLHKWVMGPKGTGFGWVSPRHQEALQSLRAGWTTFEIPPQYAAFGEGRLFTLRFLRSSCHQFAPFFALKETFEFWKQHGRERIFTAKRALDERLHAGMIQNGWKSISPSRESGLCGPLLSYDLPVQGPFGDNWPAWMHSMSTTEKLQVITPPVKGKFRLRLSPNIYNTQGEVDRSVALLSGLGQAAKTSSRTLK